MVLESGILIFRRGLLDIEEGGRYGGLEFRGFLNIFRVGRGGDRTSVIF